MKRREMNALAHSLCTYLSSRNNDPVASNFVIAESDAMTTSAGEHSVIKRVIWWAAKWPERGPTFTATGAHPFSCPDNGTAVRVRVGCAV